MTSPGRHGSGNSQPYADREAALEDGQRLIGADLLEIDGRRKHDLGHRHACRRVDRELGWNQQRIARLVRLDVKAFRKRDLQRDADVGSRVHAVGVDKRDDVGLDAAKLRAGSGRQAEPRDRA